MNLRKFIPGFIANDFFRKLISLFLAVLVWERVASRLEDNQNIRAVPVRITVPEGYVVTSMAPSRVDLILKGSKQNLNRLTPADIDISLNIPYPHVGENQIEISRKTITVPHGIAVEAIEPGNMITLKVDERMIKQIKVEPRFTGSLLSGYEYNVLRTNPEFVTVSGPRTVVEKIIGIKTRRILLQKENVEDFECVASVKDEYKNVKITPEDISVKVEIFKKYSTRKYSGVTIKPYGFLPPGTDMNLSASEAAVIIVGEKKEIELLTKSEIHPFVDVSEIDAPGEYTLNLHCWVDKNGMTVKQIQPMTVNVSVKKCSDSVPGKALSFPNNKREGVK